MTFQTGKHWSSVLKPAVLCMNSTVKKSHSYTPFQVMWGRESKYENLVSSISKIDVSHDEDYELEEAIISESVAIEEGCELDMFSPPDDHLESIHLLNESRKNICHLANALIRSEQLSRRGSMIRKLMKRGKLFFSVIE